MAKIVGGIGVSHTPTIGFAVDRDLEGDPSWSPVFRNLGEVRDWIVDRDVDALFVIYNDHVTSFYFDHYSAFALGVDDSYKPADEGGGARDLPPIAGHAELAARGGAESVEIIMWLVMRGALSDSVSKVQQSYFLPSMTAIATLILEDEGSAAQDDATAVDPYEQMHGIDAVPGTYPFSLERLSTAYKLNAFLHDLVDPEWRGRFKEDPERHMEEAGLSSEDRDLIRRSDWRGLIHRGATFFVLEKLGVVTGVSNLDIYAGMKDISLEEMLATRNEQITYSVAGKSSSS